MIEDGEPDYEGDWEVNRQNNFIRNSKQDGAEGDESNRYRHMIKQLREEHERAEQEKADKEAGNSSVDNKLLKDDPSKTNRSETENRKKLLEEYEIQKHEFKEYQEGSVILEAVRDGNIDKFAEMIILFIKKGNGTLKLMPKLFSYRDSDKRNVLHLAAYYGKGVMLLHICAVIKLLILEADGKNSIAGSKIE